MKTGITSVRNNSHIRLTANQRRKSGGGTVAVALATMVLAVAGQALAANILNNPSFEQNSGHAIPVGWTRFAPPTAAIYQPFGNYWIEDSFSSANCVGDPAHSGTWFWKEWNACYDGTNNVAGLRQVLSSSPGSIYQASGWFFVSPCDVMGASSFAWVEVAFLGANTNILALYKSSNFSASVGTSNWFQYFVTNVCDLSQPVNLGDPFYTSAYAVTGAVSQLVAPFGTTSVRYQLSILFGVTGGSDDGGSLYFDDANLNQLSGPVAPVISNLFPLNMIFVPPTNGISFNASSPSGFTINSSGIQVVVNGSNVSSGLTISGSASSKNVAYHGLQSNSVYNVFISVTDVSNLTANASSYFETTWVGTPPIVYLWEAEDWDYTNGMYINFPDLCNAPGDPNCYFGKVGTGGTDENSAGASGNHLYRAADPICTSGSGDYTRPNLAAAGRLDYAINPYIGNEWMNYTRDWPNGSFWVIARVANASGALGKLDLSMVNPDLSTTDLGTFSLPSQQSWTSFQNALLKDAGGNNVLVTLNGKATLRVTSQGNCLPTLFALVVASPDLPIISNLYPDGSHPFQYTNGLSFTVTTTGSSFPANGIQMKLDGYDVSANLIISGSSSSKNVVYPTVLPNAIHTAIITATNVLGHGILVSNSFDTFNETNYMVECEDFDYQGGQYIPDSSWYPDAYCDTCGPYPAYTNIDFAHTHIGGEVYNYRFNGIPQDGLNGQDYVRQKFIFAVDYVLVYFVGNDWANYTRTYPPGSYFAYVRSSGLGPFTMHLDRVTGGIGTTNQTTRRLGDWGAVGTSYGTFAWVPLTDGNLAAPTVLKFNGAATTLRLTTEGNCNPNFFMLVPATGIQISARLSGGHPLISFPTQAGVNYRVFYSSNLIVDTWTLLATVQGNGAVQSVLDSTATAPRYYKVTAP
ncbi:MAG: hypothetical protein C5B50_25345 [Verrucomicrobia bacterium]|nr:MAG: hypothetical protein C5B50_25345 [Verrucomicrobiota bacterium]